jgi:hypothetical protein
VRRLYVVSLIVAVTAAVALGFGPTGPGDRVDLEEARAQPCTRAGIATSLMAFFGLLEERRFYATRLLWLPRPRVPFYAYVLFVHPDGQPLLRTRRGAEMPALSQTWMSSGGTLAEVIAVGATVNRKTPRASGFAVHWIRKASDGSELVLGSGKGLWDCERRQIGRLVGSERPVESEAAVRVDEARRCGRRGYTAIRRYGQTAALCNPHRASG